MPATVKSPPSLLTAVEAARRLGVTPELIYAYALRPPKRAAEGRRLAAVDTEGRTFFATAELDAFEAYLKAPWSGPGVARPAIPTAIVDHLRVEAGGACARCGSGAAVDNAHIEPYAATRSHHHGNLIRLCSACHRAFDGGLLSKVEILVLKERLVGRVRGMLKAAAGLGDGLLLGDIPPCTPAFVGRARDVETLVAALRTCRTVLVSGVGGVGKTQLVLHGLGRADTGRPVFWIGVDALRTVGDVGSALAALGTSLGARSRAELPLVLDRVRACVVLDGVERLTEDFDGLDDLLDSLMASATSTQFVLTSHVLFPGVPFEAVLRLSGLAPEAARSVLVRNVVVGSRDEPAVERLIEFADGHPLSLRIMTALIAHFGSASVVADRIANQGARALAVPKRAGQTPATSINVCLALAFSRLAEQERRLLWVAAHSPAGFLPQTLDTEGLGLSDLDEAIAGLAQWNFVEAVPYRASEVVYALSPVRAFARDAFECDPIASEDDLAWNFTSGVAAHSAMLDLGLVRGGLVEAGMHYLERELPNALAALDLVTARLADGRFHQVLETFAGSLMMFLFTCGRFEVGIDVMRRAVDAAAQAGRVANALENLAQLQTLASRAELHGQAREALAEAERLGASSTGRVLAHLRYMQAHGAEKAGDYTAQERLSREAFTLFSHGAAVTHHGAMALFSQARALEFIGRTGEALPLYETVLDVLERENDPINQGSTLHHLGNCLEAAGAYDRALSSYLEAGRRFSDLGAVEFRGNALGEAGLLLIGHDPSQCIDSLVDPSLVLAGLEDCAEQIRCRMLVSDDFDLRRFHVTYRKFAGAMALASFTSANTLLVDAGETLYHHVLAPFVERHSLTEREALDEYGVAAFNLQWLANLCAELGRIAQPEGRGQLPSWSEAEALSSLTGQAFVGPMHSLMFRWLATYLRRHRGVIGCDANALEKAVDQSEQGAPFSLPGVMLAGT